MKKYFALLTLCCLVACDKTPINGKLDGLWQLTAIQTPDGTRDTRADRTYLSIARHLSQWEQGATCFYAHFVHEGDSIRFYDFANQSLHRSKEDNDEWLTASQMSDGIMDAWGIHTLDARFRTRQLDSEALVLEKADTTLFFKKF